MPKKGYSIVMFAHNEAKNITASVLSVLDNVDDSLIQFTVLVNGSTDNTAGIIRELIDKDQTERLHLVELEMGDKCNAWNTYIHELASDCEVQFFLDADVRFTLNAFPTMYASFIANNAANAIAGLPFSGRNIKLYKSMVENNNCLFGNCYGLKYQFIELVKNKNFKLPIGLGWIDSAITKVVNRDIEDIPNPKKGKVIFNESCGYTFDSLSLWKLSDCKLYLNRITRYRLGKMQEKYLEKISFTEWPETLHDINQKVLADIRSTSPWYNFLETKLVINRINSFASKISHLTNKENSI